LSGTGGLEFGAVPLSPALTVDTLDSLDTVGGRGSAGGHCVNSVHCVTCQRMEQRTPPIPHFSASSASPSRGDTWYVARLRCWHVPVGGSWSQPASTRPLHAA